MAHECACARQVIRLQEECCSELGERPQCVGSGWGGGGLPVLGLRVLSVSPLHGKAAEGPRRAAFRHRKLAKGRVSQQDLVLMVSKNKKQKKKQPA